MPLLLHILDAKLYPNSASSSDDKTIMKQTRLNTLIQAMKEYHLQYHGVEGISHAIHYVVDYAQLSPTPRLSKGRTAWSQLLACRPAFYLQLTFTMQLSLARGTLPGECDLPTNLKCLLANDESSKLPLQFRVLTPSCNAIDDRKNSPGHVLDISHSSVTADAQTPIDRHPASDTEEESNSSGTNLGSLSTDEFPSDLQDLLNVEPEVHVDRSIFDAMDIGAVDPVSQGDGSWDLGLQNISDTPFNFQENSPGDDDTLEMLLSMTQDQPDLELSCTNC